MLCADKSTQFLSIRNSVISSVTSIESLPVRVFLFGFDRDNKQSAAATASTASPQTPSAAAAASAQTAAPAASGAAGGGASAAGAKEKEDDSSAGGGGGGSGAAEIDYKQIQPCVKPDSIDTGKPHTVESFFRSLPGVLFDPETGARYKHITPVVHGFVPPLQTPLLWLVDNCCHADQFLYFAVINSRGL